MTAPRLCFKLTDAGARTRNATEWGPGVTHRARGRGGLCGPGWLHFYDDPLVALLLNPIHAAFPAPRLWRAEWGGKRRDDRGLKAGATVLTTIEELVVPRIITAQRVAFGVLCAEAARPDGSDRRWHSWAAGWLSGENRDERSARAISSVARAGAVCAAALSAGHRVEHPDAAATYAANAARSAAVCARRLDLPMLAAWAMTLGAEGSS